jgi:hypothetical protein
MALQASGAISLEDIRGEFNDIRPGGDFLSEYYSVATGIPRKGQEISLSDFYGKANLQMSVVYSNTDPTLVLEEAVAGRDYAPSELVTVTPSTASEFSYTQQGSETRADGTTLTRWYKNYGTGSQTGPFWQITDSDSVIRIKRSSAPIETAVTANPLTASTASAFGYTAGSETATETSTGSTFLKYTQTGGNSSFPNPIWKKNSNGIMYERTDTTEYIEDPNATTVTTSNAEINVSGGYWWGYNGVKYAKTSPAVTDYNGYSQYYDRGQSRYLWAQSGGSLKTRTSTTSTVDVTTSNAALMGYSLDGTVENGYTKWTKSGQEYWAGSDNKLYTRSPYTAPITITEQRTWSGRGGFSTASSSKNNVPKFDIKGSRDSFGLLSYTQPNWDVAGNYQPIIHYSNVNKKLYLFLDIIAQSTSYSVATKWIGSVTNFFGGFLYSESQYVSFLDYPMFVYENSYIIGKVIPLNPTSIPTSGYYIESKTDDGVHQIFRQRRTLSNGSYADRFRMVNNPSWYESSSQRDLGVYFSGAETDFNGDPWGVNTTAGWHSPISFTKYRAEDGLNQVLEWGIPSFRGATDSANTDYYRLVPNWTLFHKYQGTTTLYNYSQKRDTLVTYTYPQTVTDHRRISQTIVRFPSQIQVTRTDTSYTYSNIQETRAEVLEIVDTPAFTLDDARERLYRVSTTTDAYAAKTDWPAAPATGYNWRNGRTVQNYYLERIELIDGVYVPTALKTLQATGTPIGTGNGTPQRLVFSANADAASELTDFFYKLNRSDANAYNAVNLGYVAPMGGNYPTLTVSGTSVTVGNLESGETYRLKWYGYQETKLAESGGSAAASTGTSSEFTSASIPSFTLSGGDDTRKGMDFYLEKQVSSSPSIWAVVRCFEYFQDTNVSDLFGAGQNSQVVACDFLDLFANGRTD